MDKLIVQGEISSRILTLRGKQVMLDRDLAELYQVETKYLKRQVQRNMNRFDEDDFMFVLDKDEFTNLRSQIGTTNFAKTRAMPPKLKKAHQELDKSVDKCYTKRTFKSDKERIEFLFGLYEEYLEEV